MSPRSKTTQRLTYRISEVQEMLGVGRYYVTKLIRDGELEAVKVGAGKRAPVLVTAESVTAYLRRNRVVAS